MEIDTIADYARMLGFGKKTGVDIPGEIEGLIPDSEWKKKTRGESWYPGETISVAIGQGPIFVTPLQVAVHTAIIANKGNPVIPHLLVSGTEGPQDVVENQSFSSMSRIAIGQTHFEAVIQGAWLAVNDGGTARGARVPGFDVCGKTGSTQVVGREEAERLAEQNIESKTHSWFTGFAPKDNPRVVVTILIEYGGGGGETAAPLSKQLFELYRKKYVR